MSCGASRVVVVVVGEVARGPLLLDANVNKGRGVCSVSRWGNGVCGREEGKEESSRVKRQTKEEADVNVEGDAWCRR